MGRLFELGQIVATRGVADLMKNRKFQIFCNDILARYAVGDWGDVCDEDRELNDESVKAGERILAAYNLPEDLKTPEDDKIWIITEWDRSATTILFPSEY